MLNTRTQKWDLIHKSSRTEHIHLPTGYLWDACIMIDVYNEEIHMVNNIDYPRDKNITCKINTHFLCNIVQLILNIWVR